MTSKQREGEEQRKRIPILGVEIDCVDFAQMLARLEVWLTQETPTPPSPVSRLSSPVLTRQLCTVNPEFIMHARRKPAFAAVLRAADLCVPDGIGVLWAARRQGVRLRERVTGSDGIYRICERAAQRGWRVFLLGAAPGIAAQAAQQLQALYPALQVVGTHSGSPRMEDWPAIAEHLCKTQPDILFVAYGHPQQDLWIAEHRHELPVQVAVGVGGAIDFVAGVATRAPRWLQRLGLEWLYRLITQPWRWRRMLVLPRFVWLVLMENNTER